MTVAKCMQLATFIAVQMLVTAASAETLTDTLVSVFKDVCVTPASSEERLAAAEVRARGGNWKLLRSEPTPVPVMHSNGNGPKLSYSAGWELPLPEGRKGKLYISILRPERPGLRYTVCILEPSIVIDTDELVQSIDRKFGVLIEKDASSLFKKYRRWVFAEEKALGNCSKQIEFPTHEVNERQKPKPLLFTDFAFPKDDLSPGAVELTACPN